MLSLRSSLIFALCMIFLTLAAAGKHISIKNDASFTVVASKNNPRLNDNREESFQESLAKLSIPDSYKLKEVIIGHKNAPHSVVVYLSFSCCHCRDFFRDEFLKIRKKYADTGIIKIYLKNYLDDLGALEAAVLVRCFGGELLKKVLELSGKVFDKQKEWLSSKDPREFLKNIFRAYGKSKVDSCSKNEKISAGLMKEQQRAHELKIMSVPAFVIDGKIHQGNLTCEKLEEILKIKK